jgi:hypothetical protein
LRHLLHVTVYQVVPIIEKQNAPLTQKLQARQPYLLNIPRIRRLPSWRFVTVWPGGLTFKGPCFYPNRCHSINASFLGSPALPLRHSLLKQWPIPPIDPVTLLLEGKTLRKPSSYGCSSDRNKHNFSQQNNNVWTRFSQFSLNSVLLTLASTFLFKNLEVTHLTVDSFPLTQLSFFFHVHQIQIFFADHHPV